MAIDRATRQRDLRELTVHKDFKLDMLSMEIYFILQSTL